MRKKYLALISILTCFCLLNTPDLAISGMGSFGGNKGASAPAATASDGKTGNEAKLQDVLWNKETDGIVRIFCSPASQLYVDGNLQKDPNEKQQFSEKYVAAMKSGTHTVEIARDGFESEKREITVEAGKPYSMNFTLMKQGQKIGGMVLVPAGEFTMGINNADAMWVIQKIGGEIRFFRNQFPRQKVNVPAFYIDKYEVSNLQYKKFVDATKYKAPENWTNGNFPEGTANYPVVFVTWDDASAYAKWAGKRLPSEMEWEKAARGKDSLLYPWGDTFHRNKVNSFTGGPQELTPVGKYESGKSPYGAYDMAGNAKEWTADSFKDYPGNEFKDVFTSLVEPKVARGGSYLDPNYDCLGSTRFNYTPNSAEADLGFRCAKDPGGKSSAEIPD